MGKYIVKRLLIAVPTVIGASLFVFAILRIIPGDPTYFILGGDDDVGKADERAALREKLGLNRPLYVQYATWMGETLRGDFGESLLNGYSVAGLLKRRMPLTLQLSVMALAVTWLIAIPAGIISALKQDTWLDYVPRFLAILGLAIPHFWLGLMILLALVAVFHWLPPLEYRALWTDPATNLRQMVFPALVLGAGTAAITTRMVRSTLLEVLREDYVRTAYAKGLAQGQVIMRHAMKNAMLPVVTLFGIQVGSLISGSVVIETVFNLPGVGRTLADGIIRRDYPVVQALVLLFTFTFVFANLITDLVYAWLDPRIRYG